MPSSSRATLGQFLQAVRHQKVMREHPAAVLAEPHIQHLLLMKPSSKMWSAQKIGLIEISQKSVVVSNDLA